MSGRLRVDLGALVANYRALCAAALPADTAAVVKADGYGLGAEPVARALWSAGCRAFFVATAAEGVALRSAMPDARILVFEGALPETAALLRDCALVPVINHAGQADVWRRVAGAVACAVHIDTGMHRLGFPATVTADELHGLDVTLLLTHLACADEPDHPVNRRQLASLDELRARFPGVAVSVGNSAAVMQRAWPQGSLRAGDLCRPGIGLYGGNPFVHAANPFAAVATLEGRVLQVRRVAAGESIGYGATYVAAKDMTVAVVGVGYADGVPRLLSNRGAAAVGGRRCPIVGRVSMDLTVIDVRGCGIAVGDWVELFGATVSVDEVAAWAETIAYEVLTGLGPRLAREYLPVPAR
jgi:alanine racemase